MALSTAQHESTTTRMPPDPRYSPGLRQPLRGVIATALMIAVSLGVITQFSVITFSGWVAFWMLCAIPMILIIAISWKGTYPQVAARQRQPWKGILLVTLLVPVTAIVGLAHIAVVGGGVSPPCAMLMICITSSVTIAFLGLVIWGSWPFTMLHRLPWLSATITLVFCYAANLLLFRIFFNFDFMKDAPTYVAALDPHGRFNAWHALTYYATALACMFLLLNFELWPLTLMPRLMHQPILGLVWTIATLALGAVSYYIGIDVLGYDPVVFLVRVSVAFIFGAIVVLNMFQNSLFGRARQPLRGVLNTLATIIIGTALCTAYAMLAPILAGSPASGPPGYGLEIWLASALLSMTFPLLAIYADLFAMWPLSGGPTARAGAPAESN